MSTVEGYKPIPVKAFGSWCTNPDPAQLAMGLSPDNQDVDYYPRGMRTRGAKVKNFTLTNAAAKVNSVKSYITPAKAQRILSFGSDGSINVCDPDLDNAAVVFGPYPTSGYMRSATQFGREFMGFHDGLVGKASPLAYNDTGAALWLDKVSQDGPGGGVVVTEPQSAALTITNIAGSGATRTTNVSTLKVTSATAVNIAAAGASGATRSMNVATLTTTAAHGLRVGQVVDIAGVGDVTFNATNQVITAVPSTTTLTYANVGADVPAATAGGGTVTVGHGMTVGQTVTIAGVSDATFNGKFVVTTVPTTYTFTYANNGVDVGATTAGGGTATPNLLGNVAAGTRKFVVFFVTRNSNTVLNGYSTKPCPPVTFVCAGNSQVTLTLPVGPANVVARGIACTSANGARYYQIPNATGSSSAMAVNDNTTVTVTLNFLDSTLLSGRPIALLFNNSSLPATAAMSFYNTRGVALGVENFQDGLVNMGFEGGFGAGLGGGDKVPLGWSGAEVGFSEGGRQITAGLPYGEAYEILGNGAQAIRGRISQGVILDAWFGVNLLQPNKSYTVRFRAKKTAGLAAGNLVLDVNSVSGVYTSAGYTIPAAILTTAWADYSGEIMPIRASLEADLKMRIALTGTATNGEGVIIDDVRIVPTAKPVLGSVAVISRPGDGDSYDNTTGFLSVAPNNGQDLRGAFVIRKYMYLIKERSLHVTQDDGLKEPAAGGGWDVDEVSPSVGTPSFDGWDLGPGFAAIASRDGLYIFSGGTPFKVSDEIQEAWNLVNWDGAGQTVWVRIDHKRMRIYVGVPLNGATQPNKTWVLNYRGNGMQPGPTAAGTGAMGALMISPSANAESGRKWSPWTVSANCGAIIESASGPRLFTGNNAGNGKCLELKDGVYVDDGEQAIPFYYRTAFFGTENPLSNQFGWMNGNCYGSGTVQFSFFFPRDTGGEQLLGVLNMDAADPDYDSPLDILTDRASFKFACGVRMDGSGVGDHVDMEKFWAWMVDDPINPLGS